MSLPEKVNYFIIGAGIHGLSTAWHLAQTLKSKGKGDNSTILVVDKNSIASGASGVACGVVRNNYFQPAMRELMAHSVEVWESDPEAFHYHPVGYMQISPKVMEEDVASIYEQQKIIGYGASTKGNIVLNHCNIKSKQIRYICDENPEKYGRYTPGTNIKIISKKNMRNIKPDYLLVLICSFKTEVIKQELNYIKKGGKLIFHLPFLHIADKENYHQHLNENFEAFSYK